MRNITDKLLAVLFHLAQFTNLLVFIDGPLRYIPLYRLHHIAATFFYFILKFERLTDGFINDLDLIIDEPHQYESEQEKSDDKNDERVNQKMQRWQVEMKEESY